MRRSNFAGEFFPFDPEIDRTFHKRRILQRQIEEQEYLNMVCKSLGDYGAPKSAKQMGAIVYPNIQARNFILKPSFVSMVQKTQFGGLEIENPYSHLMEFYRYCYTLKYEEVSSDIVQLLAFPFSLKDAAKRWYNSLKSQSIKTWDELEQKFLDQYFPPRKTTYLRSQILNFKQLDGEKLYQAWERYSSLLQLCPHHGIEKWLIMHLFYVGLSFSNKNQLDLASGGSFLKKKV